MTSLISEQQENRVLNLRLMRAEKKNALTQAMYSQLATALDRAAADPAVKVVLLSAQPDCFCAGNDLGDFMNQPLDSRNGPIPQFMRALATFPKPVVAAPSGLAIGIGVTLLLHCDLVYCGEQTRLQMPFTSLGICPEFASTYLIPAIAGPARAAELLMLGEPFTAQEALAMGLVTRLAPNAEVEGLARAKAEKLAALPPSAVRATKQLLKRWPQDRTLSAIQVEMQQFAGMLSAPEAQEAIGAFLQKRKPDFSRFE